MGLFSECGAQDPPCMWPYTGASCIAIPANVDLRIFQPIEEKANQLSDDIKSLDIIDTQEFVDIQ